MKKNITIAVLIALSVAMFFYGVVQQIQANHSSSQLLKAEQKLIEARKQAEREKEVAEMDKMEALEQKNLAAAARPQTLNGTRASLETEKIIQQAKAQVIAAEQVAEKERLKALAANKEAMKQRAMADANARKAMNQQKLAAQEARRALIACEQNKKKEN